MDIFKIKLATEKMNSLTTKVSKRRFIDEYTNTLPPYVYKWDTNNKVVFDTTVIHILLKALNIFNVPVKAGLRSKLRTIGRMKVQKAVETTSYKDTVDMLQPCKYPTAKDVEALYNTTAFCELSPPLWLHKIIAEHLLKAQNEQISI